LAVGLTVGLVLFVVIVAVTAALVTVYLKKRANKSKPIYPKVTEKPNMQQRMSVFVSNLTKRHGNYKEAATFQD
jgi:hypothetical protein